jgi:hypothetical protein
VRLSDEPGGSADRCGLPGLQFAQDCDADHPHLADGKRLPIVFTVTFWRTSSCPRANSVPVSSQYETIHSRKLVVISVFRDPLERLISSFFQALSKDVYAWTDPSKAAAVNKPEDSILGKVDSSELERLFYTYLRQD